MNKLCKLLLQAEAICSYERKAGVSTIILVNSLCFDCAGDGCGSYKICIVRKVERNDCTILHFVPDSFGDREGSG